MKNIDDKGRSKSMNSSQSTQNIKRLDIQLLRGIAVSAVILFHSFPELFPNGFLGVDVFFVVSGYVLIPRMIHATEMSRINRSLVAIKVFLVKRFWRLAPALAIMLFVTSLPIFLFSNVTDHGKISMQGLLSTLSLGNIGANSYAGDYFYPNTNPFLHTWSLAIEQQFYLIVPIILLLCRKWSTRTILYLASLLSLAFFLLAPPSDFGYYNFIGRIFEFALGALVRLHPKSEQFKGNLLRLTALLSLLTLMFLNQVSDWRISSLLACLMSGVLLYFGEFKQFKFTPRLITWVGDRSYSLYLYHLPFLYITSLPYVTTYLKDKNLQILVALILTFWFSRFSYRSIEIPFNDSPSLKFREKRYALFFGFMPVIFFAVVNLAYNQMYWGLNGLILPPPYAADFDKRCKIQSLNGPPCLYGSGPKTVLLIGDSRAGQFGRALLDTGQEHGWRVVVWTHDACRFQVTNQTRYIRSDVLAYCQKNNSNKIAWIKRNKPELVILSQYRNEPEANLDIELGLKVLKEAAKKVYVLGQVPDFPDGSDYLQPKLIWQKSYLPPKSFPIVPPSPGLTSMAATLESGQEFRRTVQKIGLNYLDTSNFFCDQDVCIRYKDGQWLYKDGTHLSIYGARLLIPTFAALLGEK
jgi:peptidoglycan/LPS O-acetylase OafA/YrhL